VSDNTPQGDETTPPYTPPAASEIPAAPESPEFEAPQPPAYEAPVYEAPAYEAPAYEAPQPPAYGEAAPPYTAPAAAENPGYETPSEPPAQGGVYAAPTAPGAYPAYAPGQAYPAAAPMNTLALTSLIAGIAGLTIVPFIASIVAVITGHMAMNRLKTSGEQGRGMAIGGLVTGYIGIAFAAIGIIGMIVFFAAFLPYMAVS